MSTDDILEIGTRGEERAASRLEGYHASEKRYRFSHRVKIHAAYRRPGLCLKISASRACSAAPHVSAVAPIYDDDASSLRALVADSAL